MWTHVKLLMVRDVLLLRVKRTHHLEQAVDRGRLSEELGLLLGLECDRLACGLRQDLLCSREMDMSKSKSVMQSTSSPRR